MAENSLAQFVVCYATADGVVARLHAYGRGEGSVRDANHVRDIVACFAKGNEDVVVCAPPDDGERVMFEITLGVSKTRRGVSRYSNWDYRQIQPCPQNVAEAGMDLFRLIKRNLRRAAKDAGARMRMGVAGR